MTFPFACCPVIRECSIKENLDIKKKEIISKRWRIRMCVIIPEIPAIITPVP